VPNDRSVATDPPAPQDRDGSARTLVVQQSFPEPRPTTNPYIVMLRDALAATPGLEVRTFSWRRALTADYDVFHVHWPEILVTGSTPLKTLARQALFVVLVLRLRLRRIPWVRTQHNLELPSGISRRQRWLLRWADRWTTLRIALNEDTPVPDGGLAAVVPHGHYRDWFADHARARRDPAAFGFFGLVRRYKNVEGLVTAFTRVPGEVSLRVAGKPSSEELADSLRALAAADPRVTLSLHFLDDAELVSVASSVALVVLPYTHMHNSGSVLAALSLDTPVLVPANAANQLLADEVGPGWVLQYEGELAARHLVEALAAVQAGERAAQPDLTARGWAETGREHLTAYRRAQVAASTRS
jgi:beta-1,4-mannosyltransferase